MSLGNIKLSVSTVIPYKRAMRQLFRNFDGYRHGSEYGRRMARLSSQILGLDIRDMQVRFF